MPRFINTTDWEPIDNFQLEPAAMEVVTSSENCLVIAGPGAGKTELLAQRATYLLQTGTCPSPQKILALSYKRDAARNISERVKKRVGSDLSFRFVSLTYDAFAKGLVDRFLYALPECYRPDRNYNIYVNAEEAFRNLHGLKYVDTPQREVLRNAFALDIEPLPLSESSGVLVQEVWRFMINGNDNFRSGLTFPTINVLAEYLIRLNPLLKNAAAMTYSHVFLDEFQDTTKAQYRLVKTIFQNQGTVLTAVGDEKQRIMVWAGAYEEVFSCLRHDFNAQNKRLVMNHRSAPKLIEVQRQLTQLMTGRVIPIKTRKDWGEEEGECEIWVFDNPEDEAEEIQRQISNWYRTEQLAPRDISILVRQTVNRYSSELLDLLTTDDKISARNENEYQDLLVEECNQLLLDVIYLAFVQRAPAAYKNVINVLNSIYGIEPDNFGDRKIVRLQAEFQTLLTQLKTEMIEVKNHIDLHNTLTKILDFFGAEALRNIFPKYRRGTFLRQQIQKLNDLLWTEYDKFRDWQQAVESLIGDYTIPIMTIHKSKGLEYHTVIFLGLEDQAFWNFNRQPDEEMCNFFVALSRAKYRVVFTFSLVRNRRQNTRRAINSLYDALEESGVVEFKNFSSLDIDP